VDSTARRVTAGGPIETATRSIPPLDQRPGGRDDLGRRCGKAGFLIKARRLLAAGGDGVKTTKPFDRARGGGHLFPGRGAIRDAPARAAADV
jgi:hypothetical protein